MGADNEKLHFVSKDKGHWYGQGEMVPALKQIYQDLGYVESQDAFVASEDDYLSLGYWIDFNQKEFVGIGSSTEFKDTKFDDTGRVFIPKVCMTEECRLHVAFHGCGGDSEEFAWYAGYNEFAATNKIIVLYPDSAC